MRTIGTSHFGERTQQRSIPAFVAGVVAENGTSVRRGGADVLSLDKAARRRVRREFGGRIYDAIEGFLDVYVVRADDGRLITTGWRLERIKRS